MSERPLVVRGYRRILGLYPPALLRAHGEEMLEVVRRRWQRIRSGPLHSRGAFVVQTWGDAVVQAGIAWIEAGLRALRRRSDGGNGDAGPARPGDPVSGLAGDLAAGARSLARSPGFTAVAVLTLALGIGANTAIFSIVETVLLEPLPFPGAERLVTVTHESRTRTWTPTDLVLRLRDAPDGAGGGIGEVAGFYPLELTLTGGERPLQVEGARITPNFFRVLGADAVRGRLFRGDDAGPGASPVAVIGPGLWERAWGGADDVVGRTVRVDGAPHRIVGVLRDDLPRLTPESGETEVWLPEELLPAGADASLRWTQPMIRLGPDRSLVEARAALDAAVAGFREDRPDLEGWVLEDRTLAPLRSLVVRNVRPALLLLQIAVGVVLLLTCVNVANLLLVRAGSRQREFAVRSAMGASRGRLIRHLLSESVLLGLLGGAAALLLLWAGLDLLTALAPADVPRIEAVGVDGPVLLFTLVVSLGTAALFGVGPALLAARQEPAEVLKGGGRSATGSRKKHRLSRGLVVAQISLTLILLVGAGLTAKSFAVLTARDPGFRSEDVLVAPLRVAENRYGSVPELEAFWAAVRERVGALPGVDAVGVGNYLPIRQGSATRAYRLEGRPEPEPRTAQYGVVSPDYFRALEIPLLRGRAFREADRRGEPRVAVINESMRRRDWPATDPVGARFRFEDADEWIRVVGVVGDVRGGGLAEEPRPGFYVPYRQRPATATELAVGRSAVLLVRTRPGLEGLAAPIRRAVWEVEPRQPVPDVAPLGRLMSERVGAERFRAVLLSAFAAMALLLVVAGIYGVVAHLVGERRQEFGIRVAVGATHADVVATVLRWGLGLSGLGLLLGLAGVLAVNRYLASLLFQVAPTDPATLVGGTVVVLVVTLAACLVPARRAVSVDPVEALRAEERGGGGTGR